MASHSPSIDTTQTIITYTGLEVFNKAESEINSHFTWLHQILNDKNKAMLDKLGQKRAEFVEFKVARVEQIEEIETMKQQLLNLRVKSNKTNLLRDKSIRDYEDALNGLRIPIQTQKIIFEKFSDRFKTLISSIDLMFVEEDYTTRTNPIISIDRDSILQSINAIGNGKLVEPKVNEEFRVAEELVDDKMNKVKKLNLFRLVFDSETNRIFALNMESNNILVFQQDGTLIASLEEEFKDLTDICIDTNNRFLYVLDGENCLYKFNIATYHLLGKKENENEEIENEILCLDVHNNEIYVGTRYGGIHVFSSELEHIRSISTYTFDCIDIVCREEDIFIYSLYPAGLNVFSYNGDFIRNISLSYINLVKVISDNQFLPFQLCLDKNGFILFSNLADNCLYIYTFNGHLIHKIAISPEEDNNTFISGVVSTNDGRIFVSVYNSKYPLRCY